MCCNRNRTTRAPLLITLSKSAYSKYQQKQESERASQSLGKPTFRTSINRSPSPSLIEQNANAEILEKSGIPPPSYDDVVPPHRYQYSGCENRASFEGGEEKEVEENSQDDLSDTERFLEGVNGWRYERGEARARGDLGVWAPPQMSRHESRSEEKRAVKERRRAEKAGRAEGRWLAKQR